MNKLTIPTINISRIRMDESDKDKDNSSTTEIHDMARSLHDICHESGFFYVTGHGIATHVFDDALEEVERLFRTLSLASKQRLQDPVLNRGYTGMGEEQLDASSTTSTTVVDIKEGYYIGRNIPTNSPKYNPAKLSGPNVWPTPDLCPEWTLEECEAFRSALETYFQAVSRTAHVLVELLALSLKLPKSYFSPFFQEPLAVLRLLHYQSQSQVHSQDVADKDDKTTLFGCGAHSDYGMLTLLLTRQPGLQILLKDQWINVPVPHTDNENALVVNLGDMLERWTNGHYKSTIHRVVISSSSDQRHRYSIPFFYEPAFDTVVECLPVCVTPERPPQYPPTTSGQHLLDKYRQTHAEFQGSDHIN